MPVILGIDPGLATVGFGVIEADKGRLTFIDCGVISTGSELILEERLNIIRTDLTELIRQYKPVLAGVEEIFFARNVTTAIKVSQARGVILEGLFSERIPIIHFTPLQVKNNVAGDGAADKWQVQEMVKRSLNLNQHPKPDDAADALAIAVCAAAAFKTQRI